MLSRGSGVTENAQCHDILTTGPCCTVFKFLWFQNLLFHIWYNLCYIWNYIIGTNITIFAVFQCKNRKQLRRIGYEVHTEYRTVCSYINKKNLGKAMW